MQQDGESGDEPRIVLREERQGDRCEICVYIETPAFPGRKILIAGVTRPCRGARWFIHTFGSRPTTASRTKKDAIAAAVLFARQAVARKSTPTKND